MVLGYHVILTYYGFWLPNDPRGSWSDFVGSWELLRYGDATKVSDPRSHAADRHDVAKRLEAKTALKHSPIVLTGEQCLSVAKGFAFCLRRDGVPCHALAVMPEHTHLIVGRGWKIEALMPRLKSAAGQRLRIDRRHPLREDADIKLFARGGWKKFIDSDRYMASGIGYVERNPEKEGLPRQRWSFVVPYESAGIGRRHV